MKIGELFTLQMGKTPSRDNFSYWNGTNKWCSIADLSNCEKYILHTKECITDKAIEESGIKPVPPNTVIMSFKLSIGKTAITKESIYTNEAIMAFISNGKIAVDPDYLYLYFSNKNWMADTNKAVMGATLNKATISEMTIALPHIDGQKEIANKLDKIDGIIALRKKQLQKLDDLIKARFVEMFGDIRSNSFGFEKKKLKQTCNVVTGNTPSRSVSEYYGDYIEWIKTDNIVSGLLNPTKATESLSEEGMKAGRTVDNGSILMACIAGSIASIGRVCVTDRKVSFNQQINAITPESYNTLFLYVMLQLSKDYLVEDISMALKGILSKSKLEEKEFIVPPMEQQERFAVFVSRVDKSKLSIQQGLEKLETLKKSLMQQYFG